LLWITVHIRRKIWVLELRKGEIVDDELQTTYTSAGGEALGAHIRKLRQRRGQSLREVADAAHVDFSWLAKLERGQYRSSDPRRLVKLARVLEVDSEELFIVAGIPSGQGLPGFAPYLRAKYGLPLDAVEQLEAHFELLSEKYRTEGAPNE
jgi:transcriptional regulator with XRE-family HTH domain